MSLLDLATPVNSTTISMHERFSSLPQLGPSAGPSRGGGVAVVSLPNKPASLKNRKLAEQLERKLSNQIALRLKKKSIRQRLGTVGRGAGTVVERLGLTTGTRARVAGGITIERGRGRRGRGRAASSKRGTIVQSLPRQGNAPAMLNLGRQSRTRSRSRSRLRLDRSLSRGAVGDLPRGRPLMRMDRSLSRGPVVGGITRPQPIATLRRARSRSRGRINAQTIGRRSRSRARNPIGTRSRSQTRVQLQPRGGGVTGRGRGQRARGRGRSRSRTQAGTTRGGIRGRLGVRGRGRGRGGRIPPPSKEELDKQLDQYMATSKSLDPELNLKTDQSWN